MVEIGEIKIYIMFTPYLLQIKSFIGPQVNNTITYICFVAGELHNSSGCFHTSLPGSEK